MAEIDALREFPEYGDLIVLDSAAKRTRAESEPDMRRRTFPVHLTDVGGIREDAGQAKDRPGRIIRMDGHVDTRLVQHGSELVEEVVHVLAERRIIDVLVGFELLQELRRRKVIHRSRKTKQNGIADAHALNCRQLVPEKAGALLELLVILVLGARTLQGKKVECSHFRMIVAKNIGTIGQDIVEIAARPVKDRHEIVANGADSAFGKVADRLLVVLQIRLPVAGMLLDVLMHGNGLDNAPLHANRTYGVCLRLDLLDRPYFACFAAVKRRNNVRDSGLTYLLEGNRVIRTIPSPT